MRTALAKFVWLAVFIVSTGPCAALSYSTYWGSIARSLAARIDDYAKIHNGELPPDLNHLFTEADRQGLENELGGPISDKIIYLRETRPALDGSPGTELIAAIAFPINEDRRDTLGRYIIYKKSDGEIASKWEKEKVIRASVEQAKVTLPDVAIYNEKRLRLFDLDYTARLIADALKRHDFLSVIKTLMLPVVLVAAVLAAAMFFLRRKS